MTLPEKKNGDRSEITTFSFQDGALSRGWASTIAFAWDLSSALHLQPPQ